MNSPLSKISLTCRYQRGCQRDFKLKNNMSNSQQYPLNLCLSKIRKIFISYLKRVEFWQLPLLYFGNINPQDSCKGYRCDLVLTLFKSLFKKFLRQDFKKFSILKCVEFQKCLCCRNLSQGIHVEKQQILAWKIRIFHSSFITLQSNDT